MISLLESLLLGVIQGITEWLPISSSGHLALLHNLFGFQDLPFDVFLHFASIFAVLVIFRKDIIKLFNFKDKSNLKYIGLLIIALIPAGIFGVFFKDQIENFFSSLFYLGIFFMLSGIIVYSTKFSNSTKENPTFFDSIFIGFFQALAILPGISRSGATISSSLFRGLKKDSAVKFSFLLAIPLVLGATILEAKDIILGDINYSLLLISFAVTFLVSIITIKILLKLIQNKKFYVFGIYNFVLGILILISNFFI